MVVVACGGDGEVAPTTTAAGATTGTTVDPLASFGTATLTISGETWTVAVADTPARRAQGLMGITDLGGRDGMLFIFDEDVSTSFWMKDTLMPLDVAFFDVSGRLVDLLSMTPCRSDPCPIYTPAGEYRYAIETEVGRWDAVEVPHLRFGD